MPIKERLGADLKVAVDALMAAKQAAVKPSGLTVPQYSALLFLSDNPGISAAALARLCLVTPQTMTTILQNLESAGLIVRTPHPWHRNMLETRLTEAGQVAFDKADERAVAVERGLAAEFTEDERKTLRSLLARATAALSG
ncbi:MarR family winged helix-turn-helix transcriptional regulator [Kibdelosporangium aridum]|uniref:DNA-binding transcriptional regulator, MarR family n=1 Tax=Kibdelosporangium aridum TaxID=2030 RepID=A0A1W2CVP0_KIBAR|nr:MarR family transcriptional regulator [Kibdelosporangium aridum]RSM64081.1 MarR family transcriptional regulator [Kibdelosporangium aridum]SMC89289.1 DNA-binding transcriptional regulator, MarR family [Kibdelosporangium aridum]